MKQFRKKVASVGLIAGLGLGVLGGTHPAIASYSQAEAAAVRSLDVTADSSTLVAPPQEDTEAARVRENRWMQHNAGESTGRFVRAGETLTVELPDGASRVKLVVGLYGPFEGFNGGENVEPIRTQLNGGATSFTAEIDGMVYLENFGEEPVAATVSGGTAVPTFVLGATKKSDFDKQVSEFSGSPFVSVVGHRVFADFQREVAVPALSNIDDELVSSWDDIVRWTNDLYGLDDDATGLNRKSAGRIYITNPDSGPGYAYATYQRVGFQKDTGAGAYLLSGASDQWGLWHEIGHTYQTPQYRWLELTEVTVNISSLYVQEKLGLPSSADAARGDVERYMSTPIDQRSYDSETDLFVKMVMFDQLRRAFGDDFYAHLSQAYRDSVARGEAQPESNEEMQATFMLAAATIADRDLTPFFREWGLTVSAETAAKLAELPALRVDIWNNLDRSTDELENELPPLGPGDSETEEPVDGGGDTEAPEGPEAPSDSTDTPADAPADESGEPASGSDENAPSAESVPIAVTELPGTEETSGMLAATGDEVWIAPLAALAALVIGAGGFLVFRARARARCSCEPESPTLDRPQAARHRA